MINFILGLTLVATVLFSAISMGTMELKNFVNFEGLIIVFGGTIAIMILNSRFSDLKHLIQNFSRLLRADDKRIQLNLKLIEVTKTIQQGRIPQNTGYENIDLVLSWIGAGIKGPELDKLLDQLISMRVGRLYNAVAILQNLSKYPPSLGMIGTVIGIITIFKGLGTDIGQDQLGQNLAVAMSSTLYGLVLSNFLINPVAELLTNSIMRREDAFTLIIETARMWAKNENVQYVKEHVELFNAA